MNSRAATIAQMAATLMAGAYQGLDADRAVEVANKIWEEAWKQEEARMEAAAKRAEELLKSKK